MKSSVYKDCAGAAASKVLIPPVKWTSTLSESFYACSGPRQRPPARACTHRIGIFLSFACTPSPSIGAYLQTGHSSFTGTIGSLPAAIARTHIHADDRFFTHIKSCYAPVSGNGPSRAPMVIERLFDLAADWLGTRSLRTAAQN